MLNRKYYPFERNSYYYGKLLTAKDFEAEQRYYNDKRRFLNRLLGQNGIVSGLGVVVADDTSVVLQAGCAFDAGGREVVVPETRVVKLSTIEGYADLTTSCAYLGIAYDEHPDDEVYAAMHDENGAVKFNKIREGYTLCLVDETAAVKAPGQLEEFVADLVIYSDKEIEIIQRVPRYVMPHTEIVVFVQLRKIGQGVGEYSFSYDLEVPGFTAADGDQVIRVSANKRRLAHGEMEQWAFPLTPQPHIWGGGSVTLTAGELVVQAESGGFTLNRRLESRVKPVDRELTSFFLASYYEKAMDKTIEDRADEKLWIARIEFIRQKNALIIDRVSPAPCGQYSYNAQQLMQLRLLEQYYPPAGTAKQQTLGQSDELQFFHAAAEFSDASRTSASGVFDLGLGLGYSAKQPVFSEEIMHGLGKGPVHVEVGVEYITADGQPGRDSTSEVILGNAALFSSDRADRSDERIYAYSTAVKLLPERGTFVVGVLPGEVSELISLRIRWFAIRCNEVSKQIKAISDGEQYILINPDTVVVQPKGTAHISPVFINMPTEACNYRLVDPEGGAIDNNGVYTAPAKEGVYEIRVEAVSNPSVFAHAFAIVTQKRKEKEDKNS